MGQTAFSKANKHLLFCRVDINPLVSKFIEQRSKDLKILESRGLPDPRLLETSLPMLKVRTLSPGTTGPPSIENKLVNA